MGRLKRWVIQTLASTPHPTLSLRDYTPIPNPNADPNPRGALRV